MSLSITAESYLIVYLLLCVAVIYLARHALASMAFAAMMLVVIGYLMRVPYFSITYVGMTVLIAAAIIGGDLFMRRN